MTEINAYLSKKWKLTTTVDSDGDGFTDAVEIAANTSATVAASIPMPDLTETIGAMINTNGSDATGLATAENSLALWLDASNINAQDNAGLSNGDAISTWMDLSGNGNNAYQTVSGDQPSYMQFAQNGKGGIEFNRVGDQSGEYLIIDHNATNSVDDGDFSVFYVVKKTDNSLGTLLASGKAGSSGDNYRNWGHRITQTYLDSFMDSNTYSWRGGNANYDFSAGYHVIYSERSAAKFNNFANGPELASYDLETNYGTLIPATTPTPIHLGRKTYSLTSTRYSQYYLDGIVLEVMLFKKALTDDERASVSSYLSTKWGLVATVDSDADGFTDAVEAFEGTSVVTASSKPVDSDNDGFSDNRETISGSDPTNSESKPGFTEDYRNLLAWYSFDDGSNLGLDNGPNGNNASVVGSVANTTGLVGSGASDYINSTGYVAMPSTIDLYNAWDGNGVTFSFWYNISPSTPDWSGIFEFSDNTDGNNLATSRISLAKHAGNNAIWVGIKIGNDNYYGHLSVGGNTLDNQWHHFSWSIDAAGVWKIYIDGVDTNQTFTKQIPNVNYVHNWIGNTTANPNRELVGKIDDVRIYNKALDANEIAQIHAPDTDGDGFTDAVEIAGGSLATDANSMPVPDFTETVGAVINADDSDATGLAGVEGNLKLWLDASNINAQDNAGLSNGDAIRTWMDLSGNGHVFNSESGTRPTYDGSSVDFTQARLKGPLMKYLRSADANADHTTIIVFKADTFSDSGWNHLIYTEGGFVGFYLMMIKSNIIIGMKILQLVVADLNMQISLLIQHLEPLQLLIQMGLRSQPS